MRFANVGDVQDELERCREPPLVDRARDARLDHAAAHPALVVHVATSRRRAAGGRSRRRDIDARDPL
jgi:hypothetical protein